MSLGKKTKRAAELNARGEDTCCERAKERVMSSASLRASEASLGNERLFTGTLNVEISFRSQQSSPPRAFAMRPLRA